MEKTEKELHKFGLLGRNISYSFSRGYFAKKFDKLGLDNYSYVNFDISSIDEFKNLISSTQNLRGLNVTIPYKQEVIPFLDELDSAAAKIGAVNTIKIDGKNLKGYNTDAHGFYESLEPLLKEHHKKALVLGTGGASKAIIYVLNNLGIVSTLVSRSSILNGLTYDQLTQNVIENSLLIINCTPLGTFPETDKKPNIPYQYIGQNHLFFDLIYNPEKTTFLRMGEERGATISNGYKMLEFQAEKAWEIWNE